MTVQLCPKCNGQGTVAKPPWIPGDVHTWNSGTTTPYRCNLCDGRKVIDSMAADPTGDEEDRELLSEWLHGPGAPPTEDDRKRWLAMTAAPTSDIPAAEEAS